MIQLLIVLATLIAASSNAHSNPIDEKCPHLTYKSAPVVNADQYICHTMYALAYNYKTKTAYYSTEYLDKSHTGSIARTNDFRVDAAIPQEYQSTLADYAAGHTGCDNARCDRGHITPDQDFSSSQVGTSESFFLSNMVPQNYQNNEIIWKYMEVHIRQYVAKGNNVYVVTGPVYTSKPIKTIGNFVGVPDKIFKIVIDGNTNKSITFLMDNKNMPTASIANQVVNLEVVEQLTGIKFDSSLDKKSVGKYSEWFK